MSWESWEAGKEDIDYTGNDQQCVRTKELKEFQWSWKKQLQKTEEGIEKSRSQGQERISGEHIWQDHGILTFRNRASYI
jgi:hypothetical protein